MAKTRKEYRLPEDAIKIIEETKSENSLSTETEALIFILSEYQKKKEMNISDKDKNDIAELLVNKIGEKYKKQLDRNRLAATFSERYSYLILNAVNTMLYETEASFLMRADGETKHKVIEAAEKNFKDMIEKNKQIKDNDNLKKGE